MDESINMDKGQRIDLTKGNDTLSIIGIGLGWDVNNTGGPEFDLDACALLLSGDKLKEAKNFVFYNNLISPNHAVKHSGDNLTGDGDGDDEEILVHLSKIPEDVDSVTFAVGIFKAEERQQNFGQVDNAFIRIFNKETNVEIAKYDLTEDQSSNTLFDMGKMYKKDGEWKFQAVGKGYKLGIGNFKDLYL